MPNCWKTESDEIIGKIENKKQYREKEKRKNLVVTDVQLNNDYNIQEALTNTEEREREA